MTSERRVYRLTYRIEVEAASEQHAKALDRDRLLTDWCFAEVENIRDRGTAEPPPDDTLLE